MEILLTETELLTINLLANLRGLGSRIAGVTNMKVSDRENWQVELDGIIGEYAFCKLNNIFLEVSAEPRKGSYDCLYKGFRIDIKTTRVLNGRLLGDKRRNPDIDVYVLAIIDGLTVRFPGYMTSDKLYEESNLIDLGKGNVYAIQQQQLFKWKPI